ncbi:plantaricin C family lantibiotic [Priestia koreensis]|uniref:plantaricin C family lantibiotic n=3 Tax=Priestia koreensis TaxID=284581 RepID=UPI003D01F216
MENEGIVMKNEMSKQEQVTWFEEVVDQQFDDDVFGACTTNTFSLSDYWGNKGGWCTATHECMSWCK